MAGDRDSVPPTVLPLGGGLSRSKSFTALLTASGSSRRTSSQLGAQHHHMNTSITASSSVLNRSTPGTLSSKASTKQKRASWFGSSGLDSTTPLPSSGSTWSINIQSQQPRKKSSTSSTGTIKISKEPRPDRSIQITSSVIQGLRGALIATEQDLANLKAAQDDDDGREEEVAEKYLNRLDERLAELEELQEAYLVQNRLREGVRAIGKAYIESLGPERETALTNVKFGFKECNETLCALENRLEGILGGLHIQMKGLQGFARLRSGDVFEITLRHGGQKWRTKGKVGRDGSTQTWDSTSSSFRLSVEELLDIRVIELRSLGKQILVGNAFCETLELFSVQPQMLTVSISSSLKLSLVVTWDPLYGNVETMSHSVRSLKGTSFMKSRSLKSSISSFPSGSICESEDSPSPDQDSGQSSTFNSTRLIHDFVNEEEEEDVIIEKESSVKMMRDPSPDYNTSRESLIEDDEEEEIVSSAKVPPPLPPKKSKPGSASNTMSKAQSDATGNFLLVRRTETLNGASALASADWKYYSSPSHTGADSGYEDSVHANSSSSSSKKSRTVLDHTFFEEEVEFDATSAIHQIPEEMSVAKKKSDWSERWAGVQLEGVIQQLRGVIADIQGRYAELETFEHSVNALYRLLKIQQQGAGAVGIRSRSESQSSLTDVNHALECFDFLDNEDSLESNGSGAGSDGRKTPTSSSSSKPCVIFTSQLDETLLVHLKYSRHLTDSLGNYGPLKCREKDALSKLQVQGRILSKLSKLIEKWQLNPAIKLSIHEELRGLPHLQKLWGIICAEARSLSVSGLEAFARLLPVCRECLPRASAPMQERVLKELICRCRDVPEFRPIGRLTVFQFRYYVRSKERSLALRLEEIHDELSVLDALGSADPALIQKTITRLIRHPGQLDTGPVLVRMSRLLADPSQDPANPRVLVSSFLKHSAGEEDEDLRQKLLDSFVEGLESTEEADREGSCHALAILQHSSVVDQLAYVAQSDPSPKVRKRAKMSLQSLGPEGRNALHSIQLSSHGFQGVSVK